MSRYFTEAENIEHYKTLPQKGTGALVVFFNPAGNILLVKPNYKPGWNLVGGIIEAQESPLDAAIRETREEINLTLIADRFKLMGVQYLSPKQYPEFLRIIFSAQLSDDEVSRIKIASDELDDYKFIAPHELKSYEDRPITLAVDAILRSGNQAGYIEDTQLLA